MPFLTLMTGEREKQQVHAVSGGNMHPFAHFKTITEHRNLVCRYCFRLGLVRQGLSHDLSKYSPVEFWRGAKYYRGFESPNDAERRDMGISIAWLHHKGRNRHHYEYWIDYHIRPDGTVHYEGNKMPIRFVAEMFCDRLAASKIYLKEKYTDASPFEYYDNAREVMLIHPETAAELEKMLLTLKNEGEEAAFAYVRRRLKEEKKQ